MKKLVFLVVGAVLFASCAPKYGCPASGAAQGAEKIASGDPTAAKLAKKQKYKGRKSL